MKKRNRASRRTWATRKSLPNLFAGRQPRKRKAFSFEALEQRIAFTASPVTPFVFETQSISNDTAEGAAAILLRELQWAAMEAGYTAPLELKKLALPTDPYFPVPGDATNNGGQGTQWHLWNIGQEVGVPEEFGDPLFGVPGEDINVVPAWLEGYTGAGVLVGVIDDGVQIVHPDLKGNIHPIFRYNAVDGTNNATPPNLLEPSHGTAVTGIIAATWSFEDGGIGGVGVAPGVTVVPILMLSTDTPQVGNPVVNSFRYALMVGVDVTNNSWGPGTERAISGILPEELDVLRDSVIYGRDGLGMINVFASGNSGGPGNAAGFQGFGSYDSASYNPFANSRYTITVGGVDHDGLYANEDGSISSYPEAGASVLIVAPTGSNVAQNVADDEGQGSGIWTTDLMGDAGYNAAPDPITNEDLDFDFLADPDYTARFNGTSAAAPMVTGVIALMLEANPNLTYRDVQEILVRSARQNAQFEIAATGGGLEARNNTWQTNQFSPWRDPDAWQAVPGPQIRSEALRNPIADPTLTSFPRVQSTWGFSPSEGNDVGRQFSHYELQPAMYTNGAGYTVSQGYGAYGELIGYGHGVVDAELAVTMAKSWHTLNQDINPGTEKTFTTFAAGVPNIQAGERMPTNLGGLVVPGGLANGGAGFIAFWNEYFADPPAPFDPANADSWPDNTRGASYIDFKVPVHQQMNVEWVEVKVSISGPPADLDFLKINLTSPNGQQSELNHYYWDPEFSPAGFQTGQLSFPIGGDPAGDLTDTDTFVWTFSTNRNWGESTNSAVIIDPLTGEPVAGPTNEFDPVTLAPIPKPIFRDWELHIENWGNTPYSFNAVEIVWHGKSIEGGQISQEWIADDPEWQVPVAQRIQGFVGIDTNNDDEFSAIDSTVPNEWNNRYIQTFFGDPAAPRAADIERRLLDDYDDNNSNGVFDAGDVRKQEPFAANSLVEAYRFTTAGGVDTVEPEPVAQFLTGADGNYYFDLLPGNYMIRVTDLENGLLAAEDVNTPSQYLRHYKSEWRLTEDWFYAPDRDVPTATGAQGEIFYDAATQAPVAFRFAATEPRIPMAVQNINFLLKQTSTPPNTIVVNGSVIADVNANGVLDIFDGGAGGQLVFHDIDRDGNYDAGENFVLTNADGTYSLSVPVTVEGTYVIGVDEDPGWAPSLTGGDSISLFAGPGDVFNNQNFFLNPPDDPTGSGLSSITGYVFNDVDGQGDRDLNEVGIAGVRVFIDAGAMNGIYDAGEAFAITGSNGGYFIGNLAAGNYKVLVENGSQYLVTAPAADSYTFTLGAGETRTGLSFGLDNLADRDFGDLPDSFGTTAGAGGASHVVVPHFRLGSTVDGEVDGQASGNALGDQNAGDTDDGIRVLGDGVLHPNSNQLEVTVYGVGGSLTGWIDWNNNGTFEAGEKLVWTKVATGELLGDEADLGPGTHTLSIVAPSAIPTGMLGARFRWGEMGLELNTQSFIGEVEDYFLQSSSAPPALPGDFNQDGEVSAADYVLWRKSLGSASALPNTTNPAAPPVVADHDLWKQNFGESLSGSGSGSGSAQEPETPVTPVAPIETLGPVVSTRPDVEIVQSTPAEPVGESPEERVVTATLPVFSPIFATYTTEFRSLPADDAATDAVMTKEAAVESQISDAEMMLLFDQAIAELDDDAIESPVANRLADDESFGDVALAAVFEDESNWWSL